MAILWIPSTINHIKKQDYNQVSIPPNITLISHNINKHLIFNDMICIIIRR